MKKKSNSIFYGMIAVLIMGCAFFYSWKFIIPKYYVQRQEMKSVDEELKAATNKLESLKATEKTLDTLKPISDQLFVAIPGDKDTPNLITELEAIGVKNKLIIPEIQINDKTGSGTNVSGNAIPVSFSIIGSFENLNSFISTLEKDIRFTNIKSVSLTMDQDTGNLSMSLQIEVYKRAKPVASSSSAAATASSASTNGSGENL